MRQMMQKLFLVQTDNFLPKMCSGDVNGQTQGESQNMLVRKQNLRVLGISLKTESRVLRLCWNVTLQSVPQQLKDKIKSSICYQGSDARKPSTSFTRGGVAPVIIPFSTEVSPLSAALFFPSPHPLLSPPCSATEMGTSSLSAGVSLTLLWALV